MFLCQTTVSKIKCDETRVEHFQAAAVTNLTSLQQSWGVNVTITAIKAANK